jgi:hypothetical protein
LEGTWYEKQCEILSKDNAVIGIALLVAGITRSTRADEARDFFYIGDASNTIKTDTVQRFDATAGAYLGPFITVGNNG